MKRTNSLSFMRPQREAKNPLLFFLLFLLAYTNVIGQDNSGFFLNDWQVKNINNPTNSIPKPQIAATPTTTVNINPANVVTKVSKYVYGHNAAVWGGKIEEKPLLLSGIQNLNPHVIRWPGGNMSNDYFWNATSKATCPSDLPPNFSYSDMYYGSNNNSWTMSLDSYYKTLQQTNATGTICVNYAYARYGTSSNPVAVAAHHAADWVRHDRGRTKFWEIGNENYGAWETGYDIDTRYNKDGQPARITGELYGKHCRVFIDSMRKAAREVGADIKIGIVLYSSDKPGHYAGPQTVTWNQGVIPQAAAMADFLIVHMYMGSKTETDRTTLLNTAQTELADAKETVNRQLRTFANLGPKPITLTEWNINSEGQKQMVSYVNGLHGALILGGLMKYQYGMATRWDFLNGFNNGDSHSLFADEETDATKYAPRAPYFYMYYFQKYFGDKMVASDVQGNQNVVSFASTFSSGQTSTVLVNKGGTDETVSLKFSNFVTGSKFHYYVLTGGTDNGNYSRKVFVNGQGTNEAGGGPTNYHTLPAYSTDITNGNIKLTVPKFSAVYVLVEKGATPTCSSTITYSTPTTFCTGGSVMLKASAGASYQWFNGTTLVGTAATYTAVSSGAYSVSVTNASGCVAKSAAVSVTVTQALTWYQDTDGDGSGDATKTTTSCTQPAGYVSKAGDACPTDPLKTAPGNCGCNKTETSCVPNTTEITGPACGAPLQVVSFTLAPAYRTNANNYSWWFTGSADQVTPSADKTSASVKLSQYFSSGEVCVGVNLNVAPYYKQYCKAVTKCAAKVGIDETIETDLQRLSIYPNPAADYVTIDASGMGAAPERIQFINQFGDITLEVNKLDLQTEISTSELIQGAYTMKVFFNGKVMIQKLMIIK